MKENKYLSKRFFYALKDSLMNLWYYISVFNNTSNMHEIIYWDNNWCENNYNCVSIYSNKILCVVEGGGVGYKV